jgi:hypothetical protein
LAAATFAAASHTGLSSNSTPVQSINTINKTTATGDWRSQSHYSCLTCYSAAAATSAFKLTFQSHCVLKSAYKPVVSFHIHIHIHTDFTEPNLEIDGFRHFASNFLHQQDLNQKLNVKTGSNKRMDLLHFDSSSISILPDFPLFPPTALASLGTSAEMFYNEL